MIDSRGLIALLRKCLESYTPKVERVAQIEWDTADGTTPPPLPYALVVPQSSRYVYAGERVAREYTTYDVELYTRGRDLALERSIADAMAAERVKFRKWLNPLGHGVNETVYELTVIGI